MKVMVTGGGGQLARALAATAPPGTSLVSLPRAALDVTDALAVAEAVNASRPGLIVNTAAYTDVDAAERHEAAALAVNGIAPGLLARAAREAGAAFVHVSTDFVFGRDASHPYSPDAKPHPINAYGRTKYAGEQAAGDAALIVRTSWLYAAWGRNIVRTLLDRMSRQATVELVCDQTRAPTCATGLAEAIWGLAAKGARGVHHHTDSGTATLYDLAVAVEAGARLLGLLRTPVQLVPVSSTAFPEAAPRPAYSVLDCSATAAALGRSAPHWRVSLSKTLRDLALSVEQAP